MISESVVTALFIHRFIKVTEGRHASLYLWEKENDDSSSSVSARLSCQLRQLFILTVLIFMI